MCEAGKAAAEKEAETKHKGEFTMLLLLEATVVEVESVAVEVVEENEAPGADFFKCCCCFKAVGQIVRMVSER